MKTPKSRKVKGTAEISVLLEKIPRQLIEDAKAKCRSDQPPTSLRWRLLELLKAWTYPTPPPLF